MSGPLVEVGAPHRAREGDDTVLRTITTPHPTGGHQVDIGLIVQRVLAPGYLPRFEVRCHDHGSFEFYRDLAGAERGALEFARRWHAAGGDMRKVVRPCAF